MLVKCRIRPIRHLPYQAMLHRVPVYVIHMPLKISLIPYLVFPVAPLPQAAFAPLAPRCAEPFIPVQLIAALAADMAFDHAPAFGEIRITFRQSPDAMQVVRQQHLGQHTERIRRTGLGDAFPQCGSYRFIGQHGLPPVGVDGEEIGATPDVDSSVFRHMAFNHGEFVGCAVRTKAYRNGA